MSFLYADCSKAAARPVRVWSRRRLCALHARSAASSRVLSRDVSLTLLARSTASGDCRHRAK